MSDYKSDYKGSETRNDDKKALSKADVDEELILSDEKGYGEEAEFDVPVVEILDIDIQPNAAVEVSSPLHLRIKFNLDRDVVAAYWSIKLLVDSSHKRIIILLGDTDVEDYPDGESEMFFSTKFIDIGSIEPSTLTNSGLLMAVLVVNGEEVLNVNMVCIELRNFLF